MIVPFFQLNLVTLGRSDFELRPTGLKEAAHVAEIPPASVLPQIVRVPVYEPCCRLHPGEFFGRRRATPDAKRRCIHVSGW
jgi:hypothetical protein